MTCKICETRRPRRYCPGVAGEICTVCCGTEREVSVNCPLDCEYLREARNHEKLTPVDPGQWPNKDVRISEEFLRKNERLLMFVAGTLADVGLRTPGAVDLDVREALDSLIRTYRTRESGLYYETRPNNLLAANIHQHLQQALEEYARRTAREQGITSVRDADILGVLVFVQRVEFQHGNGRPRGRAFLDFLRQQMPSLAAGPGLAGSESRLIVP